MLRGLTTPVGFPKHGSGLFPAESQVDRNGVAFLQVFKVFVDGDNFFSPIEIHHCGTKP